MRFKELLEPGLFPVTLLVTTAILLGANLPGHYRLVYALQDSGHFLIFTLLTLTALWPYRKKDKSPIWQVMLGCLLFGILIEGVQSQIHRDPSLYDVLMDLTGIVTAVVLYLGFIRRAFSFGLTIIFAIMLAMAAFSKPCYWLIVYEVQADEFPQLINPDSFFANGLLEANPGGGIHRIELPDSWSIPLEPGINSCIYVSLLGGRWPGILMREPESDWRGYDRLKVAIYSDQADDLPLTLSIQDQKHNHKFKDRYTGRLLVHPGYNHFSIPLSEIEQAPKTRTMDMGDIADVKIFASKDHVGEGFCLLSMGLR